MTVALLPRLAAAWELKQAPIMSPWAELVDPEAPLPEYPRPQMVRSEWMNLNGLWEFQAGSSNDPVPVGQTLAEQILVPFPMESALSGIMRHHERSWYRRTFSVPPSWDGRRILLHLDAVDFESEVFINGQSVGVHRGGYDAFTYDITDYLTGSGPQELIVRVYDPTDHAGVPRGKQTLYPGGIMYTACSGIWQTVWLEPVAETSISDFKLVPDIDAERLNVTVNVRGPAEGVTVNAVARIGTDVVGTVSGPPGTELHLPVPDPHLWSPDDPFLYDLDIALTQGSTELDAVSSYFGMRKISLGTRNGKKVMLLNNEFVFQFGPLDQGFWPDGIYRAPTDDALAADIVEEKTLGYNMVRKHIKVEPPRWYYWADKLGILVWQDMPSANSYTGNPQPLDVPQFETELRRMVESRWNHPSIIMWVIFNESQGQHNTEALVQMVKTMDPSRLVNQASGGSFYGVGDILDWHSYPNPSCPTSSTQAVVCGEFGGVGLSINGHIWAPGWGYVGATDGDDLAAQFENFCYQISGLVQNQGMSGAVYTEITDVEIELNGFLTYDRKVRKLDPDRVRAAIALAGAVTDVTTVLPTSQTTGQHWKYRTTPPFSNWTSPSYNDSNWNNGVGGFGGNNPPNTAGLIRTSWTSSNIWLRRTFEVGSLTPDQIDNLYFNVYHDEDVEIYINGVLAGSATGYTTNYTMLAMTPEGRGAIVPNATNLLAVHCRQTGGGQYIDVGIVIRESDIEVPPRPATTTPTGLTAVAGKSGVSLGWTRSPHATDYHVKRSTTSGGPYTPVLRSPVNAATDATVAGGTTYYYVVSASNAAGETADSQEIAVTTPVLPPADLVTWLKADDLSSLTDGDPIATWTDASGRGFNATQENAARRPAYASAAINGQPAVRFNAAANTYLSLERPVQDDFTIFCVFQSSQGLSTSTHFYDGAGLVNAEVATVVNDFGLSLNADGKVLGGTGNPDVTVASGPGFNDGRPHLVTFRRTQGTGLLELYVDGQLQGIANAGRQSLTSPARLVLGAQQTLIKHLTGDIAEVKIFSGVLPEHQRLAEEKTLICKYGLWSETPEFDCNANGIPDECESDADGDGVIDACDNCPAVPNPDQTRHVLDADGDCDIDSEDVQAFIECASGPQRPVATGCQAHDVDGDGDVDQDDFGALQRCLTGPDAAPAANCTN
ncbi:MAG TPA: glycoside hydrolase family 2 TIM barrel-domain containing protein [Phycisphaerae bacterium]|nr:glycoside hydrolase family 2 TIM barrel-domain containing protein [Phycisphaerae bacterium]